MARPLRFRYAPGHWSVGRLRSDLLGPLNANLGAQMSETWFRPPDGYEARRFDMDNGDTALFCWDDDAGYWLGNTETPSTLWRTDKKGLDEVDPAVTEWAEKEFLAELHDEDPWLKPYPALSWYFLPVFCSKDGRETTRTFFAEHAGGFPDAERDEVLAFYDSFLATGALDDYREVMAGKLGTSDYLDLTRMSASMAEFNVGKLLHEAGYDLVPEAGVTTGHSIDYRVERDGKVTLVEVTRPLPPNKRAANTPIAALKDTAATKTSGQLESHGGGVTLFVDCSSFPDDDWNAIYAEQPDVRHRPAVVFRCRPDGSVQGYTKGSVPLDVAALGIE